MRYCCNRPISDTTYNVLIGSWGVLAIILTVIGIILMTLTSYQFYGFLVMLGGIGVAITLTTYLWNCCGWKTHGCCSGQPVL